MNIKMSSFCKEDIAEISIFSGYPQAIVREVLEFKFLLDVEKYFTTKKISLPYIGNLDIKFLGDKIIEGNREAIIEGSFTPSDFFKRIIGEAEDGNNELIQELLEQKIRPALSAIINDE